MECLLVKWFTIITVMIHGIRGLMIMRPKIEVPFLI